MALRTIGNKFLTGSTIRPFVTSKYSNFPGIRKYSVSPKDGKFFNNNISLSIIDSLPGDTLLTKTGYITVGVGLLSLIISKELYVFNEETLLLFAFTGMATTVFRLTREPFNEFAQEKMDRVNNILDQTQENHKTAVKERIGTVQHLGDLVDVTKAMFEMSKDTAKLEAEAFELKQKVIAASEIKSVLDSWVRYEATLREREQKDLANHVIGRVMAQLQNEKLQNEILSQAVIDLEISFANVL
ncbi:148_t:CDS:2 [Diversispora eburnea]|uniref:ATP synthase subunit 4 n=1 Tax=Diversispora eburnea TaxID=1213867 RepID=A0A9N9BAN6_9GLOM|nr:148_t:CDS:2 [Diversispora eburnea]